MIQHWLIFFACSGAIVLAGVRLAPYGEAIGRRTGIGQGWIGLLFLATLTSIPEMTTTITGAGIGAPNIALGNAFGSNLFNVAIVAVMDIMLLGRGPFLRNVRPYHVISGGVAVLLTSLAVLGIVVEFSWTFLGISPISWMILLGYVAGVVLLFHAERQEGATAESGASMSLLRAVVGFSVCTIVVVASGIVLVRTSHQISVSTGLSSSLMGAVLVAIVTSLPELAASVGALRIGAFDMIVGNLLGSNMFNILTVFFADTAFRSGSILNALGEGAGDQIVVAVCGVMLTVIAMIAITVRSTRKILGIGVDAVLLGAVYVMATALIVSRGV
jgi:cation:H+ antiporter